ncbi:MAG TPA: protein-L-isoaspartate(D-aspartate) O-methyltransferase [Thermoproteota archaeon]|nr:protein-L-isoaspartate(D-aspartate) O-methyltransferase [Thermoproteota archaeon]
MTGYDEQRSGLVSYLKSLGVITSERVERAFLAVHREEFVSEDVRDQAYVDTPLPLMNTGQTISAPSMLAYMVEALDLKAHHNVLEVGAGSGYGAAVMAEVISPSPSTGISHKIHAVEIDPRLVSFARGNLHKCGYSDRVDVILGDGALGLPEESPFDRIMVSAAATSVPRPLTDQLADGGMMVIPVGGSSWSQELHLVHRVGTKITEKYMMDVVFVPLKEDQ